MGFPIGFHGVPNSLFILTAGKYLESGEYEYNLYGTKLDSIKDVCNEGR
jgi:guanylate kinase